MKRSVCYHDMMYILLLIYFVNIVTGDDSSESKYIDLLPEKEKEDFLETVARRIFDNIKHKNAIPERDEHTKLIEKVLKEESLNLKRFSQNTSDDSEGKSNEAGEDGYALDLAREGKRNKRNSLKDKKNSDIAGVQRASKETNKSNLNELSKELGISDTEDIEVKHINNKQNEVTNLEINTKSNIEGIGTENTVRDLISKENSSVHDGESNHEQERNTTKSPPSTYKPEETGDTNEEASESIETTKTPEHSYSPTEKINVTSRRNGNPESTNDSLKKDTKQESVTVTLKTSLSTSPDVLFTETTSEEALEENKTKSKDKTKTIMTISPKTEATETTTELSKINETRKSYDKLASIFYTDDLRDDRENQDTKAVTDDKTFIKKTDDTTINVELDDKYFEGKSTVAAVEKNLNHISLNDLPTSIKDNYKTVTEKIKNTNSVTDSENKDTKSSETIVNSTESSNETIIKVIKNSKDYIKKKHSMKKSVVNDYKGTTLGNNISPMTQSTNVIDKRYSDIITTNTTTMDTLINDNNEINIEKSPEKTQNKNIEITDGSYAEENMQSNKIRNGPEIGNETSKEILIDKDVEIEMKNNSSTVLEINNNKREANNEQVITESINKTIIYENSTEKTKSNSSEIRANRTIFENNTTENNNSMTSETYIETTTVKIETLTVATDLNKTEANDKDFRIKEDAKPYINQNTLLQTPIANTNQESVLFFENDDNKIAKNLQKMEKISANFVNDMIKVIRASFSDKPNKDLKPLRLLDDNPKPKEYKVFKAPNIEPLDQNHGAKDDNAMEENPYYVPVYNYGPEYAYYNPKNRLGPNADDDGTTIIKNDGLNVESIAHDYDSIVNDIGYNENDNLKNYYQNRQDLNDNDARNDVDYDEAYNKERDFIDRMGDIGNYIFIPNENLRGRDTENTQKLKKVEYMKNLVKIYKNRNGKNNNRKRSFNKYKLNLPIVLKYPKYSDIIMNSHDYLDVDYRYPTWNKPKHTRYRKHRILRGNGNNLIIKKFADDPNSDQEDIIGVPNPTTDDKYKDDLYMLSDEPQNQETVKPFKVIYDEDYENYIKKPLQDNYGKPNSMNLFESGEYVWETQDTEEKRNKKKMELEKSHGIKKQIRKIREMMYSTANFGFNEPKVEEKNYNALADFIKEAHKMCDGEDESCVEPFVLINNNHLHSKKQSDSARHAMNHENSIPSDYFIARTNNTSDFVVDYVPKLSARSTNFKFDSVNQIYMKDQFQIKWITDFSEIHDKEAKSDCSFCSNSVCHSCVCGISLKFCKIPETRPSDDDSKNDHHHHDNDKDEHHNHHHNNDNDDDMTPAIDGTEQTEEPKDEDIPNTTVGWHLDIVQNISMLPSYLDPILEKNHEHGHKENYKKYPTKYLRFRSRNDKLPPKTSVKTDDKSLEDNSTESQEAKPNIIMKNDSQNETSNLDEFDQIEYDKKDTKTDEKPDTISDSPKKTYNKIKTLKSIVEIIPDDVEIVLKVADMFENQNSEEDKNDTKEKEGDTEEKESEYLRSIDSIDLESYETVLQDMVRNDVIGLVQYDWLGTSIDIQAAIFKLKEMIESVKNNEVLDQLDFKLLKYFTFLHKFSMKRQKDLRMFLPKPKYKYNRTRSEKGVYSRTWLKRRLKKFAFEVSGTDLYYFVDFLDDLQFYLYDLHTALTQIAMVTSYENQNWFKNLSELYLGNSRKNILELLLHFTTVRLLDLVENDIQTGLQDGFLRYVINNEKEIEKSKNELVLILRIIEELKKSE